MDVAYGVEGREKNTRFCWANLTERQHFGCLGMNGRIN